ncbi:hypothetical protein BJV78DRAFT_1280692 [Lactifluus subvellereus]|nr:hypothetical protein BJV78DRAFT_1280692 [Lactifluus subvellereus]
MRAGQKPSEFDKNAAHIFGAPLNEGMLRALATAILGGYRHDLPLVVFLCDEELYHTGTYKSSLFRDPSNRRRHHSSELITLFDTPPTFGKGMSLRAESTPDIRALLLTYSEIYTTLLDVRSPPPSLTVPVPLSGLCNLKGNLG